MPETPERDIRDPRVGSAGFYGGAPVPLWVTPDDLLIVGVRSIQAGITARLTARLWHPDGSVSEMDQVFAPGSAAALQFFSFQLYYGYLVYATIQATGGGPTRGRVLANIQVARPPASAFFTKWFLAQDYLTSTNAVFWPFGRSLTGAEGPGTLNRNQLAIPGAGADWTLTVPGSQRVRIRGATATLVTSAAVATRQVSIVIDDGAITLFTIESPSTQLAGVTQVYDLIPADTVTTLISTHQPIYLPPDLVLFQGWRIRAVTGAIQAADQWSAINFAQELQVED